MNSSDDIDALGRLNAEYIHSDQYRDIPRYREILADDFIATLPDLVVRSKTEFLEMLEAPRPFSDLAAHDVNIRLLGDFALIHGRVTFNVDGEQRHTRYTDTWQRREDRWLCIAADVSSDGR
jgi:ketosteroid isomerase-like protein